MGEVQPRLKIMIRIILDTNILFSALAFDKELEKLLLFLFENNLKYQMFASIETLQELDDKLLSPKFLKYRNFKIDQVKEVLDWYKNHTCLKEVSLKLNICRDPRDNKFLELAKTIQADYLISGDKDLLKLKEFEGTKILKPSEFMETMKDL